MYNFNALIFLFGFVYKNRKGGVYLCVVRKLPMTKISSEEIRKAIKAISKPKASTGLTLPFNSLGDREFEILLYQIYKHKIEKNENDIQLKFDSVDLMEGVGEKGRDCALMKGMKNAGIIQCKKVNTNISKPQFVKEVLKFILFSIKEKNLISDANNFTYYFAVSTGLAGTTKELIRSFNENILLEKDLENWTEEVIAEYKQFSTLSYSSIKDELNDFLRKIKVERILPQDIELWLSTMPQVKDYFFETTKVVDNSLIESIEQKYLIPIFKSLNLETEPTLSDFNDNFKEYLSRTYVYYSSARTLVFGNQQKKLEDFYYPLELLRNNATIKTKTYPDDLLPKHKKVIIVDSGGMGKSTIMKWLFTRAIKENKGIPIFIELRLLSENNQLLDEIISQINPLHKQHSKEFLVKVINKGNFIFFLDGYDEIKATEKTNVTKDISEFISKASKNEFIITSRPENVEGIFGDFLTFHIKPLTTNDAYNLIEKIGDYNERSKALIKKLQQSELKNIKEFLKNPLLISLLYKKFEYRESIPLQKQEFYYEVFEALYKAHDLTKGSDYYIRPKESNLSFSEFYRVLRLLGFRSIQDNELEYNKSVLQKLLEELKGDLPNINFDEDAFINDLTMAVPLFQKEGLKYRWAHKSIQEYFAAEFICIDTKEQQKNVLLAIFNGERLNSLIHVLELCYDIDPKTFQNSILYSICSSFTDFCNSTFHDVINEGKIPIIEIRDRQFRMFIDDTYLIRSTRSFRTHKEAKKHFISIAPKIKMISRVSADSYYVGSVKKRENVRKILSLLTMKKNKLIKEMAPKDFMYEESDSGYFNRSAISLFNGEVKADLLFVDDKLTSAVNDPKYFKNVSLLIKGSYFNYDECQNIIASVEKENEKQKKGKTFTAGF